MVSQRIRHLIEQGGFYPVTACTKQGTALIARIALAAVILDIVFDVLMHYRF